MPEYQNTRISDIDRGISEALRYYGGPLGEQVINAANFAQMFSPVTAIGNAMQGAKAAANPDRAPMERVQAGIESLAETASVAAPLGAAGILARAPRIPGRWGGAANDAAGALEEAIVGSGQLRDVAEGMTRRQFLQRGGAAGAMAAAGMKLPSEELLGRAATKAVTNPLGAVVAKYRAGLDKARELSRKAYQYEEALFSSNTIPTADMDDLIDRSMDDIADMYRRGEDARDEALMESLTDLRGIIDEFDPDNLERLTPEELNDLDHLLQQPDMMHSDLMEAAKTGAPDEVPTAADAELVDTFLEIRDDPKFTKLHDRVRDEINRRVRSGEYELPDDAYF